MKKMFLLMAIVLPFVFISCGDDKDEPVTPDNHNYVDLGLPSRTLWATCNVGADSPEQNGDYFAWGETEPKDNYSWENYKWVSWKLDSIVNNIHYESKTWYKYYNFTLTSTPITDGKTELDPEDDAARVNWGPSWRMPSLEQMQELLEKCDWQWTQLNGVNGHLVTGPNGNTIFLPVAGGRANRLYNDGKFGYYWSRTLCSVDKLTIEAADHEDAYIMFLGNSDSEVWYDSRCDGSTVRAVCVAKR